MTSLVNDPDFTLHVGDALETLTGLPDGSVDCVVTSPPYWGLRDYSTNGQLGLEATPDEYVQNMVGVFGEVRRVLADHGTLWLNIGDSYASTAPGTVVDPGAMSGKHVNEGAYRRAQTPVGLKPKDLVGVPWRVAFALQADGWYLRSDIIWSKPNPMPESVTDRPTKAHEYVFLLSKGPRYFFDQEAVREKALWAADPRAGNGHIDYDGKRQGEPGTGQRSFVSIDPAGRNVRSVWEIATRPFPEAHFATYPPELVRRCLLAGCPEFVCETCGTPRERIVERTGERETHGVNRVADDARGRHGATSVMRTGKVPILKTAGWSDCGHAKRHRDDNREGRYRPGSVLDPFLGSGTTALVAREHGRRCVGIELNPEYAEMAARRLGQLSLLA